MSRSPVPRQTMDEAKQLTVAVNTITQKYAYQLKDIVASPSKDGGKQTATDVEPTIYETSIYNDKISTYSTIELAGQVASNPDGTIILKKQHYQIEELLKDKTVEHDTSTETSFPSLTVNQIQQLNSLVKAIRFNHNIPHENFRLIVSPTDEIEKYKLKVAKSTLPNRFGMYKSSKSIKKFDPYMELDNPNNAPDSSSSSLVDDPINKWRSIF